MNAHRAWTATRPTVLRLLIGSSLVGCGVFIGSGLPHTLLADVLGDINGDGKVDVGDLSIVLSHWTVSADPTATPLSSASPVPSALPADPTGQALPGQVIDLTHWKLTLPTNDAGAAQNSTCAAQVVTVPKLTSFTSSPWFQTNATNDGVAFRANVEGCVTSGSTYPRSLLSETTGSASANASWSTTTGTSSLSLTQAVTHLPVATPQTVPAGIANASGQLMSVTATKQPDGTIQLNAGTPTLSWGILDSHYVLGTKYDLKIVASGSTISVYYNDVLKASQANVSSGDYFEVGDLTGSNITTGSDAPGAYGEVVVYDATVSH